MRSTNPMRVIIVDDHPAIRKDAELLLQQTDEFIVVGSCGTVREAAVLIPASNPDVLLLDINLGNETGFDLLEQVTGREFKIIFLTAYEEFAIKAIKAGALDYLLKPINEAELKNALNKVINAPHVPVKQDSVLSNHFKENSRLILSSPEHLEVVELKDIIFCHSDSGYTTFHLTDNRKIVTSKYLKEYQGFLTPDKFIRTHQSYVVNLSQVHRYHRDGYLLLRNGLKIPVATRRKEMVKISLAGT